MHKLDSASSNADFYSSLIDDSVKGYVRPELKEFTKTIQWVAYRIFNALKHLVGYSDWQIARHSIATKIAEARNTDAYQSRRLANLILYGSLDKKMKKNFQNLFIPVCNLKTSEKYARFGVFGEEEKFVKEILALHICEKSTLDALVAAGVLL